ncbi:MAG: hypothetical protein Q9182_001890 [Xanthomendoza sp. 2 TL-2023]
MEETNYHGKSDSIGRAEKRPGVAKPENPNIDSDPEQEIIRDLAKGPQPKRYLQKLKPFDRKLLDRPNRLKGMVVRPLIFLTFPVILYAGFSYGSNLVWFNVLNGTTSLILSEKPYAFSSSMVGLSYVSPLLGAMLGMFYTGRFGDWFVLRIARKRSGIMEPEYRLWLFSLSILLLPGGLVLWGVGAAHEVHWFGLIFAMGILGFTSSLGLQLSISYCIDSYQALSGEAIVTVILLRNTMSFAIGYGLTPWVKNLGLQNAFVVAAMAGLAQTLCFLIYVRYGRDLREATAQRYRRYADEMAAAGLVK